MRTAEEIKEWVFAQRWRGKDGYLHQIEAETLDRVLKFIESEPPSTHPKCVLVNQISGNWPIGWHLSATLTDACIKITHCPDCGQKLETSND